MDYGYFYEELDKQWNGILQKYQKAFSFSNNGKEVTFEEALKFIFHTEQFEYNISNEDKELCEKCILELVNFMTANQIPPVPDKLHFLLNMIKYMCSDETCFINLNMNGILNNIFYLTQPTQIGAGKLFKITFSEWFSSSLEHQTGVTWIVNSQYWLNEYHLVLQYENDSEISNLCYDNLTKLLDKLANIDYKLFQQVIQTMTKPLIDTSIKLGNHSKTILSSAQMSGLKSTMRCLLEVLERLLKQYSKDVLNELINCKIGIISDHIARQVEDSGLGLTLERISILLSFFSLTEIFDGIQTIKQDPLVVSGFFSIVDFYISKGDLIQVFELYYYGIKYSKYITDKLPKYTMKGKLLDIETEILTLQLEPIILVSEKVKHVFYAPKNDESIRMSHLAHILKTCSLESLQIGFKIKKLLTDTSFEVYTFSLEAIIRSKELYSEENLGGIFESLIYSFEDLINYVKSSKEPPLFSEAQENFIIAMFKTVFTYIDYFSPSWGDRVKALDIPQIMFELLSVSDWNKKIVVEALMLMKVAISKRLCPCMTLLIDTPDSIKDLGPLLYRKCFNSEWEIRNAVLEVICTIANNANNSFASFKGILDASSLPSLVSTMALNDENATVKATAFKCLQEFVSMDDTKYTLRTRNFINKVLNIIATEKNTHLQSEAINFVKRLYYDENLPADIDGDIYKCLEHQAINNPHPEVREATVHFWFKVAKKIFTNYGCVDCKFPPVLFSKRIVVMTKKEVRLRLYKILTELSQNGCLRAFKHFYDDMEKKGEMAEKIRFFFQRMYLMLVQYEVFPDSALNNHQTSGHIFNHKGTTSSNVPFDGLADESILTMPDDLQDFCSDEDLLSVFDTQFLIQSRAASKDQRDKSVTPSEFVAFVHSKMSSTVDDGNNATYKKRSLNTNDLYNIIDY